MASIEMDLYHLGNVGLYLSKKKSIKLPIVCSPVDNSLDIFFLSDLGAFYVLCKSDE